MTMNLGAARPAGFTEPRVVRPSGIEELIALAMPSPDDEPTIRTWKRSNYRRVLEGAEKIRMALALEIPTFYGALQAKILRGDGRVEDYGLVSLRVVTTVGVNFIVDAFQNLTELEILKYHGIGTGAVAEAVGDTALGTELTTQYNPDNTRATGTLAEGASANIFRSVGTNAVDATVAITEQGMFSQAATGGGTLLDRSVFSALNLVSGDSLQTTYDFTISAGG
jgi:hypothetical protein